MDQSGNFDPPWVPPSKREASGGKEPKEAQTTLAKKVFGPLILVSSCVLLCSVLVRVGRYARVAVFHNSVEPLDPWAEALTSGQGLYNQVIVLAALFYAMALFAPRDEREDE